MKLTASLLLALLTSCVGPTLAPAFEGDGGAKKYEIAAKALAATAAKVGAGVCPVDRRQTTIEATIAEAIKSGAAVTYHKFSRDESAKLTLIITDVAVDADLVVALVPSDNDKADVFIGFFKNGCGAAMTQISHQRYDVAVKIASGQVS